MRSTARSFTSGVAFASANGSDVCRGQRMNQNNIVPIRPEPTEVRRLFKYKITKTGAKVNPDLVNATTMLMYDEQWQADDGKPLLRFDEFSGKIRFEKQPPWFPDDKPATPH